MSKKFNLYEEPAKTNVAIILDRSGSMSLIREEAIDSFNEQVETIKDGSKGMETRVSLVTFSTNVDTPTLWNRDVKKLKRLKPRQYVPSGFTSMLDAVGYTINRLKKLDSGRKNEAFLVIVISDGLENNSKEFSWESVADLIKECQSTKRWTFTYLGSNQDISEVAKHTNIPIGNFKVFKHNKKDFLDKMGETRCCTNSYFSGRARGLTGTEKFYDKD